MPTNEKIAAAIYIGAYTTQMQIARINPEKNSFDMQNQFMSFTNMTLDRTENGCISDDAMKRVLNTLHEFRESAIEEGVSTFRIAATSSLRNIPNRSLLFVECRKEFDTFPCLLSGRDEASLTFVGAITAAMANLPVVVTYAGYNNFYFAYGTSSKIDGAFELDLSIESVNELLYKKRSGFNIFKHNTVHRYIENKLSVLAEDYKKWRGQFSFEPEFMAVGPLPFGCLSIITKQAVFESVDAISAMPLKAAALTELTRKLTKQSPEALGKIIDKQIAQHITAGAMVLRGTLELSGNYEFRVTPYGVCAGVLRSPAAMFQ